MTTRVVMADDHARLRARIRHALEDGGCEVLAEGATADEAVALTIEHRPDVALLDVRMPGGGIRAAADIAHALPEVAVVMLTQSADEEDLFDALRAGASGYLLKNGDPATLCDSLRSVLAGERALSPRILDRVLDEFQPPGTRRLDRASPAAVRLTGREREVMEVLSEGLTTEQAAVRIGLSPSTIRLHVSTVLTKLRVTDRESALRRLRGD